MTREEYNNNMLRIMMCDLSSQGRMINQLVIKDTYIGSLESKIAELEAPKSCFGCKYLTQYGCNVCAVCERHEKCIDRYEPKDTE